MNSELSHSSQEKLAEQRMRTKEEIENFNGTQQSEVEDKEQAIGHPTHAVTDLEAGQSTPVVKKRLPTVFSPQLKKDRIALLKAIIKIEVLLVVIVLGILSIYWGGLASLRPNTDVLTVAIVDFDE